MSAMQKSNQQEETISERSQRGKRAKRRGKDSENELARLLTERLGTAVKRNLAQSRASGHDLLIPGWSLEVKRSNLRVRFSEWWEQTLIQAERTGTRPALAYRIDRQPWRFVVALRHLAEAYAEQPDRLTAELCLDGFCLIIRESLPEESSQ